MTEVMDSQRGNANGLDRSRPANRALPVAFVQRSTVGSVEQPRAVHLLTGPAINQRNQLVDQGDSSGALVLQGVYEQLAGPAAREHSTLKSEPSARHPDPVTGLQTSQLAPSKTTEPEHKHEFGVPAVASIGKFVELSLGQMDALPFRLPATRSVRQGCDVDRDPAVSDGVVQDRAQRCEVASDARRAPTGSDL